jgi:geranylgeranyl diphosphate synthase, type I
MTATTSLKDYFAQLIPLVEAQMHDVVNAPVLHNIQQPKWFNVMLNYHLGFADAQGNPAQINAGKRIRPMLVLLACEACGGDAHTALPAAAAVELLHNFSLIHDDIEDGDELRRGRLTVWKQWNVAQAINAGDAMFAQAHLALQRLVDCGVPAARVVQALRAFDAMCVHLTIGQHLDMSFETRADVTAAEYMAMIEGKTAALVKACCEIGAIVAGADEARIEALGEFGRGVGLSFQLQDDVLGIWGDPAKTGKQDSDLAHGKKTLPVLFAAEHDARVRELYFAKYAKLHEDEINQLKQLIEAAGGRAHTEQAAEAAYANSMESWESADLSNKAGQALRELAQSLLGRSS